ncbi:MAG: phosphoribosylaminoimidazolesuccinocarboxamide synthase [Armatimonadota bacterium]|nr:phosphoribosylaminoimidazolesuccinocarboxamide synthase [Armatimonadota bacterium]MDR7423481.1 phosphoribosylaminoimidazolesuccinocarboxamide synthase [Armatimonadota bacterium]MDR7454871.1 phosphoribosylaminoimidazolesuccinocarboxamide synthase [Armatimonadota bacterium]MDR7457809.1 phosphoribosylaminoimidazolesuccinocarboxamide synthase [Armatimonadota bacterium]MDR7497697.1 phosphoribosylaminoimidazolesuccinocarboxamide synthase [Armatimonadota bacterium]
MIPPAAAPPVQATNLPMPVYARGKVRDVYALGDALLIVATDRISAFDSVLPTPVPDKGRILTQLSAFWFARTRALVPNHMITADIDAMPEAVRPHRALLAGRAMLVRRAARIDLECVVRGYLAGGGWQDYRREGAICGVRLPEGLVEGARLEGPIFTPATKAVSGHDQNVTFEQAATLVGEELASRLRETSLALYGYAHAHAAACGLLLADTKFEFGVLPDGTLALIDEALTPDSSRYWDADAYARGELVSFDKQYVRNHLLASGWNREPPAPVLPAEVVEATRGRYRETYRRLVGEELR